MRQRDLTAAAALLLVSGVAGACGGDEDGTSLRFITSGPGGQRPPYAYQGRNCHNAIPTLVVDSSRARSEVPSRFSLVGEPVGIAVLFLTFTSCDLELEGSATRRTAFADAGVLIDAPDGIPGLHVYWLWDLTDSVDLARLDRAYGVPTEVPSGLSVTFQTGLPLFSTAAEIPWSQGAYGSSATYLGAAPPAVPGTVSWWRQGPAGLVRLDQAFAFPDTETQGIGTVTAEPGSRLSRLAGELNTTEFMLTFADLVAKLRVVEPP